MSNQATIPEVRRPMEVTPPAEVQSLSGGILAIIDRASRDPNVDVDKLERLLAMQERVLARDAEQAFNEAMRKAQEQIKPILVNRKNPETKSEYADLEAVSEEIDPVIHANGFSPSFGTDDCPLADHYRVTCHLSHVGGHSRDYQADVPIDNTGPKGSQNKTRTHGFGSSLSYGRRYLKLLIFDATTTKQARDDDGNAAGRGATIDDAQIAALQQLADASGADLQRFCKFYRIDALPELPAAKFEDAQTKLQQKLKGAAK